MFIEFAARVKGDPSEEIEFLIRKHLAKLDEVIIDTELFRQVTSKEYDNGDPNGGLEWPPLWLPNGTELRMRYRQKTYLAKVRFDAIQYDEDSLCHSVSQWVRQVARGTARNAWHDVWIKFQDSEEFVYADALRQVPRTGKTVRGESRAANIIRLAATPRVDDDEGHKE
ncbi:hypothetical protein ACTJK5_09625 [Agrobacterium sp. 22094]|uniref:hypothetical protein n=1 Tax=Agrobacterium sp. 22094 TaxID=3453872 RepID=UPI003F87BFBF